MSSLFLIASLSLVSSSGFAFDPYTVLKMGETATNILGLGEKASDTAETLAAASQLYGDLTQKGSEASEEEGDLLRKVQEAESTADELKYNRETVGDFFDSEKMSSRSLAENIRYARTLLENFRRLIALLGRKPQQAAQLATIQQTRISAEALQTQQSILYQILSQRIEDKSFHLKLEDEITKMFSADRVLRKKLSSKLTSTLNQEGILHL